MVKSIINEDMVDPRPSKILWLYAEDQPLYKTIKNVEFEQGVPDDIETRFETRYNNLLVIDDLMTKLHSDERLTRLFSVGSHHKNLSIIFITHNLFHHGREMRTLSLNSHYMILFKNPRDGLQIATLARQMYPGKSKFLVEVFEDATRMPHGYILIDLKPSTPEELRIRTGIRPGDLQRVYVFKDTLSDNATSVGDWTSQWQNVSS